MYYNKYKNLNPDDILVYIEEFNKEKSYVVFDFIDKSEYNLFARFVKVESESNHPSMVILENYKQRTIQENTIYSIRPEVVENWVNNNKVNNNTSNSFLIGYIIDTKDSEIEIFSSAVALEPNGDYIKSCIMNGDGKEEDMLISCDGKLSVSIRNVGQGNWNEIKENGIVKIVYDAGASMYANRLEVRRIIGNQCSLYSESRPNLVISHWDKDHYHSLIGMTDNELSNFSFFICRSKIPNLTSSTLFNRIKSAIGSENTLPIHAEPRIQRKGPVSLIQKTYYQSEIKLYNAQEHKNRNISGILLSVRTNETSVIFSGDCHYEQISRDVLKDLDFKHNHHLIVPHHGGKAGTYIYNLPQEATPKTATISVGINSYGHPDTQYVNALEFSQFDVFQTKDVNDDITFNL